MKKIYFLLYVVLIKKLQILNSQKVRSMIKLKTIRKKIKAPPLTLILI